MPDAAPAARGIGGGAQRRSLGSHARAVAAHGVPRATVDLDVWIDASPENVRRVWAALVAFGAPLSATVTKRPKLTAEEAL